ncbi:uncharacterized protein LOC143188596 [Calliopsis andreniformis]|uniref:uncharacterized protein LOC143188596 n=1 Tax=Calliopsis andreniformis TaxID=337506 RepID=UPI003FCDD8F1
MAPRMLRDYHGATEPNSYSLRTTTKRGEDYFAQAHDVNGLKIKAKEVFLRSMGLQMKRYQSEYTMLDGSHRIKKINIPNGVELRDCSVVILGSTCKICGKCFKCVRDLNMHEIWKHRKYLKEDNAAKDGHGYVKDTSETYNIFSELSEDATISIDGSPAIKVRRKLRLTLRIGTEVIARMTMKRKHLKTYKTTNIATQTEHTAHNVDELIMEKSEGAVPRIDLPVFDNSPCQCCNSGLHVVNSTNQYLAGNIVASRDTKYEESTVTVPVMLPITVPNNDTAPDDNVRTSLPLREESPKSSVANEKTNDDEIQEVLRIVRGGNTSTDINHESPNRNEQEMLVQDAIRDMIRMEEQGWHLLEKELPRKKIRSIGKSNARNGIANENSANRRKKATIPLHNDINVNKNTKETRVSCMKELFAKVQNQHKVCLSDNVKENLMTCNGNINVPSEVLNRYGINYYNETFEINNNTQIIQEPVSCFLAPCSGGIENWNNKPTIIDLVNDTDE